MINQKLTIDIRINDKDYTTLNAVSGELEIDVNRPIRFIDSIREMSKSLLFLACSNAKDKLSKIEPRESEEKEGDETPF